MNRIYFFIFGIILTISSCTNSKNLVLGKIQDSKWFFQEIADCQEVYSFKDSTFALNSCEVSETFKGNYWIEGDTLFLLIPKPKKQKIVVSGDTVELDVQMLHYVRPTLERMIYKDDTLFFLEIYNNYQEENQSKFTEFEINYMTRVKE
jgi:hypothetical protein